MLMLLCKTTEAGAQFVVLGECGPAVGTGLLPLRPERWQPHCPASDRRSFRLDESPRFRLPARPGVCPNARSAGATILTEATVLCQAYTFQVRVSNEIGFPCVR